MDASLVLGNLLTPPILFFLLGMAATLLRSDLEVPQPITRALSLYLLFAIGLHGGVELARSGFVPSTLLPLGAGALASALVPVATFFALRRRLGVADAAALGATYGSISAVTFITASSFLADRGEVFGGHMVAAMALMESPAILVGVLLARRFADRDDAASDDEADSGERGLVPLLREAVLNGPVFLLVGSLLVGILTGEKGWEVMKPFAYDPFHGVLALFLLDMGIIAARRLDALRASGVFLTAFALVVPLINASLAIGASALMGLGVGDALLFTVLCASASYIAVPAAVRVALPRANPSLYLPMSLALTFPFNIALGIPLYYTVIVGLWEIAVEPIHRIEIVVDALHSPRVIAVLAKQGVKGYTLIRSVSGSGERGLRQGDDITGVSNNNYVLTTCTPEQLDAVTNALRPVLRRVGGICLVSDAHWVLH